MPHATPEMHDTPRELPTTAALRGLLASVPEAGPRAELGPAIGDSVAYLGSDAALRSLASNTYWPKWDGPWWHMVMLHELGEARRIPTRAVDAMVAGLAGMTFKIFPIEADEAPGANPSLDIQCHCALGTMYQVLTACGVEVDRALPWIKPWFSRYQMADGGLSCDETAYRVTHECPSSMVGTIAAFEAMLLGTWSAEQAAFLDRAAGFLVARELRLGSPTVHNAEERVAAAAWVAPCFPRFYFYDVLRGVAALSTWAERSGRGVPRRAIAGVVDHLVAAFPDGVVRVEREGAAVCPMTWRQAGDGAWQRTPTARPPLLDAISVIGAPSAVLTRQWSATRQRLIRLLDAGQITA